MNRFPFGKIPVAILNEVVFKNLGAKRREVTLGPTAGIDGAVLNIGEKSLITSMDPITGAIERIGWISLNINANDVATFGVEPAFFLSCILLPETADRNTIEAITNQMDKAARKLGIAIVGGHCEVTPELRNTIVVGCAMGLTKKGKYVTAAGAQAGDKLILTKSAGLEGTAILVSDREQKTSKILGYQGLKRARKFYEKISVVEDAITAFRTGGVDAMHDPTEGGVAGGAHEIADASKLGVRLYEKNILVEAETSAVCNMFNIDPLQLISSGALLIAAKTESSRIIIKRLADKDIPAAEIGEFVKKRDERVMVCRNGNEIALPRPSSDHLWIALFQK